MDHVAFIDDDAFWARSYIVKLSEHFRVSVLQSADDALAFFSDNFDVDAIILDVMMPTPDGVDPGDVNDGLDTGLWLLSQLKQHLTDLRIPVLVLTNRDPDRVRASLAALAIPEGLITVRSKVDTPSFAIPLLLKQAMEPKHG